MTSPPKASKKPVHHPQRQKVIIRKNCRNIKECSTILATEESLSAKQLCESGVALTSLYEACTGVDQKENETEVEAIWGSLPQFLGQFKREIEDTIVKIGERSQTAHECQESEKALHDLLAISTDWHQRLQQRVDEARQTRQVWEENHPVQAAQEHELSLYVQSLQPLLDAPSARAIPASQWLEADMSLESLQVYLLDNKISAEQVKSGGQKGLESMLRLVLRQMEEWDAEGLGLNKDERVDIDLVEKIWGRVDKIGSGLNYLLVLDARGDAVDGVKPTTRSVFLLKSAPPARISFSSSRNALFVKKLSEIKERLVDIVLDPNKADIKRDDEMRWNAAYRELETLEKLVKGDVEQVSQETISKSGIGETIGLLCTKLESLHMPPKANEDDSAFALMYASWQLAMHIGAALGLSTNEGSERDHNAGLKNR